jgi:hypothetical protein
MKTGVGCAALLVVLCVLLTAGIAGAGVNVSSDGLIVTDSGYPGGSVTIIEVVKNPKDSSSESEKVTYYLVNESETNATPVQIGTADLTPSAGGEYTAAQTFLLPVNLADGVYTYVREAMGSDVKTSSGKTIRISEAGRPSGSLPDLVGLGAITPRLVAPGESIRVIGAVGNSGGADAGRFAVDFYLANRSTLVSEPLLLGIWDIESIPAGGQATTTRSFTVPASAPPGEYGILMDVNPDHSVTETDYSNNNWYREGVIGVSGPTIPLNSLPAMIINTTSQVQVIPINKTGDTGTINAG